RNGDAYAVEFLNGNDRGSRRVRGCRSDVIGSAVVGAERVKRGALRAHRERGNEGQEQGKKDSFHFSVSKGFGSSWVLTGITSATLTGIVTGLAGCSVLTGITSATLTGIVTGLAGCSVLTGITCLDAASSAATSGCFFASASSFRALVIFE